MLRCVDEVGAELLEPVEALQSEVEGELDLIVQREPEAGHVRDGDVEELARPVRGVVGCDHLDVVAACRRQVQSGIAGRRVRERRCLVVFGVRVEVKVGGGLSCHRKLRAPG